MNNYIWCNTIEYHGRYHQQYTNKYTFVPIYIYLSIYLSIYLFIYIYIYTESILINVGYIHLHTRSYIHTCHGQGGWLFYGMVIHPKTWEYSLKWPGKSKTPLTGCEIFHRKNHQNMICKKINPC